MPVPQLLGGFIAFINSVKLPLFSCNFSGGLLLKIKVSEAPSTAPYRKRASVSSQNRHQAELEEKVPITLKHRVWAARPRSAAGRQLPAGHGWL